MTRSYKKVIIISTVGLVITILGIGTGTAWVITLFDLLFAKVYTRSKAFCQLIYIYIHIFIIYEIFMQLLTLSSTSFTYDLWVETPIPMYLKFYMFNWTNPQKFYASSGEKPHFQELGPYVFR